MNKEDNLEGFAIGAPMFQDDYVTWVGQLNRHEKPIEVVLTASKDNGVLKYVHALGTKSEKIYECIFGGEFDSQEDFVKFAAKKEGYEKFDVIGGGTMKYDWDKMKFQISGSSSYGKVNREYIARVLNTVFIEAEVVE